MAVPARGDDLAPLLLHVEDESSGATMEYAFRRSPVRIGRSARNDLRLPQRFVSSWHGVLEFDDDAVRYTDLGSRNGTVIGGERLAPRTPVPLGPGDQVTIGSLRLTIPARPRAAGPGAADGALRAVPAAPPPTPPARAAAQPAPPPTGVRTRDDPAPEELPVAPGGITAMMKRLAAAPADDFDRAWRRVLVPGAVIGRFELGREVGRGSFGLVFEAKDRQLGRLVAFKAVRPGRESQVLLRQETLQKEAEAAARLNHPNIVTLHDVGTCESGPYLIMELLHGETLRDRMQRGRLPLVEAVEIAIEIAWALDHAHAAGVVHRDLKPANVFLTTTGHVKVLDFGIAHVFGAGSRTAVGTPAYMAPEQWRQEAQDPRTDVFGAAVMTAEMVTGHLPYRVSGESSEVLEPGARPALAGAGLPAPLTDLLRRALSADPASRPEDGHAWLAELLAVHEQLERTPSTATPAPEAAPPAPERGHRTATRAAPSTAVRAPAPAAPRAAAPRASDDDGRRPGWTLLVVGVALVLALAALAWVVLS